MNYYLIMTHEKIIDFRKSKKISESYKKAYSLAINEQETARKVKVWTDFLNENLKKLEQDDEDKHLIKKARKNIEALKKDVTNNMKKRNKRFFLDFLFSQEKRFKRLCSILNVEIIYENIIYKNGDLPAKIVDIDYDNVTFLLILEKLPNAAKNFFAKITLQAFDDKNVIIGTNDDRVLFLEESSKVLKQIYVPNSAKDAYKYKIFITFAKNSSI